MDIFVHLAVFICTLSVVWFHCKRNRKKIGFLKKNSLAYLSFKKGKFLFLFYKKEKRGSGGIYDFEFCRADLFSVKVGEHFFYEFSF